MEEERENGDYNLGVLFRRKRVWKELGENYFFQLILFAQNKKSGYLETKIGLFLIVILRSVTILG